MMRELFMHPKNAPRMLETVMSLLAGDIHGKTPIWTSLALFKGVYELGSLAALLRTWRAWRQPRAPTFSRAALADAGAGRVVLFISGTASIVGERSLHPGDVIAKTEETLRNLLELLAAAMACCSARFTLADLQRTAYVRRAADAPAILALWAQALPCGPAPRCVQADICRAELLVEIEAHAFAPGALA